MWNELKESLQGMIEDEDISLGVTPVEKTSERLMMIVRKKAYEGVLGIMSRLEEEP